MEEKKHEIKLTDPLLTCQRAVSMGKAGRQFFLLFSPGQGLAARLSINFTVGPPENKYNKAPGALSRLIESKNIAIRTHGRYHSLPAGNPGEIVPLNARYLRLPGIADAG
jgi:hypothetical protein